MSTIADAVRERFPNIVLDDILTVKVGFFPDVESDKESRQLLASLLILPPDAPSRLHQHLVWREARVVDHFPPGAWAYAVEHNEQWYRGLNPDFSDCF